MSMDADLRIRLGTFLGSALPATIVEFLHLLNHAAPLPIVIILHVFHDSAAGC